MFSLLYSSFIKLSCIYCITSLPPALLMAGRNNVLQVERNNRHWIIVAILIVTPVPKIKPNPCHLEGGSGALRQTWCDNKLYHQHYHQSRYGDLEPSRLTILDIWTTLLICVPLFLEAVGAKDHGKRRQPYSQASSPASLRNSLKRSSFENWLKPERWGEVRKHRKM